MATTVKTLRLGAIELQALIDGNREAAAKRRAAFLRAHAAEGWIACVVADCQGLVAPRFARETPDGHRYGFCPRRDAHRRLVPTVFAQA